MNKSIELPSNRTFGLFWFSVTALACGYMIVKDNAVTAKVLMLIAAGILIVTVLAPERLRVANLIWLKLGILLSKIFSPLIFAVLYVFLLLPVALGMRLIKRDVLELDMISETSYWRKECDADANTFNFRNQY